MKATETTCPSCQVIWSEEEVLAQECIACGYPNAENDSELDVWESEKE